MKEGKRKVLGGGRMEKEKGVWHKGGIGLAGRERNGMAK